MASIHSAAKRGDVDMLEHKLHSDPTLDVNAQDGLGNGVLHLSARFGHKELLEMLFVMNSKRFPFNPFLRNKEGKTALEVAIKFDHADCSGILSKFPYLGLDDSKGYTESVVNGFSALYTKVQCLEHHLKQAHTKTESTFRVVDAPEGPRFRNRYAEIESKKETQRTIDINEKTKWEAAAMARLKGEVQALKDAPSEAHLREASDDTKLKEEADIRMVRRCKKDWGGALAIGDRKGDSMVPSRVLSLFPSMFLSMLP
jgi:ankyrin repeat protein